MSAAIKLYEATAELDAARDLLIESGGELTPEIEELLAYAHDTFGQKAELVKVRLQNNPPSVKSTLTVEAIETAFADGAEWVIEVPATYRVDNRLLLDYHKAGRELPAGVTVEQGKHVRIS